MNADRKEITLTIRNASQEYVVTTFTNEYRNLMVLLNNSIYLEGFGECGGQGRCATCLIRISSAKSISAAMDRNEKSTLHKVGLTESNLRLACQILITDLLDGEIIEVFEEG